ncbi:uncharacterized protein LOC105178983 [Sesamum indicum]|uniref:Uncharacterized protein LOC105178983 n=1 Tax=Sesamum indicum TaxID=4182 RepID=A0A6I9UKC6_SESIN|nr:uncharacterized protein LOC105178983 [Sesamum indicum]
MQKAMEAEESFSSLGFLPLVDAYLKGEEQINVRVKLAPQSNVEGEQVGKIHKEEAVCRFCFNNIFQYENIFMTKCNCKMIALTHENCAMERWRSREEGNLKCEYRAQDIQNVPVTLSRADKKPGQ